MRPRFARRVLLLEHPAELSYWMGAQPCWAVIRGGVVERIGAR